jgi:hypothetical protein
MELFGTTIWAQEIRAQKSDLASSQGPLGGGESPALYCDSSLH